MLVKFIRISGQFAPQLLGEDKLGPLQIIVIITPTSIWKGKDIFQFYMYKQKYLLIDAVIVSYHDRDSDIVS